ATALRNGDTGNFEPQLNMLTDDFQLWALAGPLRGKNIGRQAAAENYGLISGAADTHITLEQPSSTLCAANR
ncbi:hypothetical protein PJJ85_30025, partial [Mycobacterium kansasii]